MCIRDSYVPLDPQSTVSMNVWGFGQQLLPCLEAVSYTHLDVYKRQPSTRAAGLLPFAKSRRLDAVWIF